MKVLKATDRGTRKKFLDVARVVYTNDPVWVCPFDNEIEAIFTPEKNPYHKHGEVERWIMYDDKNNLTGRIAAFIDKNLACTYDQPTGGIGFFECINDKKAAFLLFDTAKEWLVSRGMEAMDGPINTGDCLSKGSHILHLRFLIIISITRSYLNHMDSRHTIKWRDSILTSQNHYQRGSSQ